MKSNLRFFPKEVIELKDQLINTDNLPFSLKDETRKDILDLSKKYSLTQKNSGLDIDEKMSVIVDTSNNSKYIDVFKGKFCSFNTPNISVSIKAHESGHLKEEICSHDNTKDALRMGSFSIAKNEKDEPIFFLKIGSFYAKEVVRSLFSSADISLINQYANKIGVKTIVTPIENIEWKSASETVYLSKGVSYVVGHHTTHEKEKVLYLHPSSSAEGSFNTDELIRKSSESLYPKIPIEWVVDWRK